MRLSLSRESEPRMRLSLSRAHGTAAHASGGAPLCSAALTLRPIVAACQHRAS